MDIVFSVLRCLIYLYIIFFLVFIPYCLFKIADELKKIRSYYDSLKK